MSDLMFDEVPVNQTKTNYKFGDWKDQCWGVDINLGGQNNLGKILMKIREYWK